MTAANNEFRALVTTVEPASSGELTTPEPQAEAASLNADNPWPGLLAFREVDRGYFQGRDSETEDLFRLAIRERLIVFFGLSGLGKSSLLQAGLFPMLRRENILPVYVRLDFSLANLDLIAQVKSAIAKQAQLADIEAPAADPDETLWAYFHRRDCQFWTRRNRPVAPLIAFDQFEEIFTLGRLDAQRTKATETLLGQLADLVEGRVPAALRDWLDEHPGDAGKFTFARHPYKVLLSIREDFLPELELLRERMPSVALNRLRLQRMNGRAALRVVAQAKSLIDLPVAEKVVRFVAAGRDGIALENLEIEPALLSVVCRELNSKRQNLHEPKITESQLEGSHDKVLHDFYERTLTDLPVQVRSFIEEHLLTVSGFRDSVALENALSLPGITNDYINKLVGRRLVRREDRGGIQRLELIHDLLTGVVREHREQRRSQERAEKRRREQRQRLKTLWTIAAIVVLALLSVAGIWVSVLSQKAQRAEEKVLTQSQEQTKRVQEENDRFKKLEQAAAFRQAGFDHLHERRYQDALQSFRSALRIYQEQNKTDQVSTLVDIGDVLALMGNLEDAERTYTEAQQIHLEKADRGVEAKVLESLASLKERQDRLPEALKYYDDANRVYQDAGDYQGSGRVLERLAFDAEKKQAPARAANLYQNALKAYDFAGDELGKMRANQALERLLGYWGFLVDLRSGQMHELKAATVNIGRDVEGVKNDISFSDRLVSRRHLAISRDLHIDDMRSRNGTSINARLLPYGIGAKLSDKDIIVLANIEPLQFWAKKPAAPLRIPRDAWALFIDGDSKSFRYLTNEDYSLVVEDKRLSFQPGSSESALVRLRRGQEKPQMLVANNQWKLAFTFKETDYEYKTYIAKTGEWGDPLDVPVSFVKLSQDEKNILVEGPVFQIVFFTSLVP